VTQLHRRILHRLDRLGAQLFKPVVTLLFVVFLFAGEYLAATVACLLLSIDDAITTVRAEHAQTREAIEQARNVIVLNMLDPTTAAESAQLISKHVYGGES
jgi:hypothetical protein